MTRFALILVLGFSLLPAKAFAWGSDGHKLVCALAYSYLSDNARRYVDNTMKLGEELDGNPDMDFADGCIWPDTARYEDYKGSYEQHFINIPEDADRIDFARDCAAMDCIAVGIQRSLVYLMRPADGTREKARQAAALRFLGHFIGDLHQPLHVSHGEDWGGNKIKVKWFGEDTNLHAVWDRGIMDHSEMTYPDSLEALGKNEPNLGSTDVLEWMQESFKLARSHAYPNVNGLPVRDGNELGNAYYKRSAPIVVRQLVSAATRLAYLIEGVAHNTLDPNILIN